MKSVGQRTQSPYSNNDISNNDNNKKERKSICLFRSLRSLIDILAIKNKKQKSKSPTLDMMISKKLIAVRQLEMLSCSGCFSFYSY